VIELKGFVIQPFTHSAVGSWEGVGYLVDDSELSEMIMGWDNKNLSILPEFFLSEKRATTESMADVLCQKIRDKWKANLDFIRVSVWETPCIVARSEWKKEMI
jgi:hypothetical protein